MGYFQYCFSRGSSVTSTLSTFQFKERLNSNLSEHVIGRDLKVISNVLMCSESNPLCLAESIGLIDWPGANWGLISPKNDVLILLNLGVLLISDHPHG